MKIKNIASSKPREFKKQSGFTLVELIISTVLISLAVLGVIIIVRTVIRHSADPMLAQQSTAIAESYLEEITGKAFPTTAPCPAPSGTRANYSNICDYAGLTEAPTNELGNPMAGLGNYTVAVNVDTSTSGLSGLTAGTQIVRIDVTVSRGLMRTTTYSVYRANY